MVNLLITLDCNRDCVYCFAKEKRDSYSRLNNDPYMSMENLDRVLTFLEKGYCYSVQLAGGEPTIHPTFKEILDRTLSRGFYVNILSNCLWSEDKNEYFSSISPTRMGFLLNVDHPDTYEASEWAAIQRNLRSVGGRRNTTLSFNIFEEKPRGDYVFELAQDYDVRKIRLSFSMPVVFGDRRNISLPIEGYEALAPYVVGFTEKAKSLGITVRMDNTVPLCMFTKEQLADLLLDEVIDPKRNFVCFPAIDVGPDLSVWRCFGTSGLYNRHLDDFKDLNDLYGYYEAAFKHLQEEVFPMEKCYECEYAGARCQGGCIGYSASKCIDEGKPLETVYDDLLSARLVLGDGVSFERYSTPENTLLVSMREDFVEMPEGMMGLVELLNGENTLEQAIRIHLGATGTDHETDPLDDFLLTAATDEVIPMVRLLLTKSILAEREAI